jgi:hypothetical protein
VQQAQARGKCGVKFSNLRSIISKGQTERQVQRLLMLPYPWECLTHFTVRTLTPNVEEKQSRGQCVNPTISPDPGRPLSRFLVFLLLPLLLCSCFSTAFVVCRCVTLLSFDRGVPGEFSGVTRMVHQWYRFLESLSLGLLLLLSSYRLSSLSLVSTE